MRMFSPLAATAGLALALAAAGAMPVAPATAQSSSQPGTGGSLVQINTGRGRLVTLARPMSDLFVADDSIADVQVRSPTQLYIFGKKAGETTISATAKGGQVVFASTVRVGNNLDSIGGMLGLAMPDAKIVATPMNGFVLLTGTVAAPADAAEAERLVQAFVGENTKVLSRLRTATPLQVNLQVRIAEVSRSFVKNIGVNLTTRDNGNFLFGLSQGRQGSIARTPGTPPAGFINGAPVDANGAPIAIGANGLLPGQTAFQFPAQNNGATLIGAAGRLLGVDLLGSLDLGETIGQVTTLANPNLTSLSGETATFLAGGEIPIPIAQTLGTVTIEYKQYGVSLAYTPTVLADGRISLRVRPEVSQLTSAGAVTLNNFQVPAFTTRRAETTVELGSGQSLMIGGLLSNNTQNQIQKAPGLGDLPVLGSLFRSNGWQRNETELVIVITPYLVKPADRPDQIALPTDGYQSPTDIERVLLGKLSSGNAAERRPVPTMAPPTTPLAPVPAHGPGTPAAAPAGASALRREPAIAPTGGRRGAAAPGFSN
ncbi:type II and III secretion system protein family protein [Sphingomonas rubra]|uniref:Pilus assembly protein CpaC n=1 Tax=Sphingomonas rubra TaxID=634430 RepID=A0A1I5UED0_9SPHN|nr:type II and III secretion system protein family protein [Sphingomonas rubra]SFP93621.1 pilus assembly protein CpaC [Sphingomonas rubra]